MMTEKQIRDDWAGLQKRQASEVAEHVYRYCEGRSAAKVAGVLGYAKSWVREHLNRYAVETAIGKGGAAAPLGGGTRHNGTKDQLRKMVTKYKPKKPNSDYVDEWIGDGYTREVAETLSVAYEAAEKAVKDGAIKESHSKENERISKIVLPDRDEWEMRLKRVASDVKFAARVLDQAQINDLKRAATRKAVASAHADWSHQIERLKIYHPTFLADVAKIG